MLKHVIIIVSLLFSPPLVAEVGTYDSVRKLLSKDFWNQKSTKKRVIYKGKIPIVRDFMKMCLKPNASQKFTLDAIVKNHFSSSLKGVTNTKEMCETISERYIEDREYRAIHLRGKSIVDVTPLQYLTQVDELSLNDNNISDIRPLSKLVNLRILQLGGNPIKDIKPLHNLKSLEDLGLFIIGLENIQPLSKLTSLKSLRLASKSNDKSVLKYLVNLERLSLIRTNIKNICTINRLKKLSYLSLLSINSSDISCLKDLKDLKKLHLDNLPVTDISVVSNFTKLEDIQIKEAPVKDISVLKSLKNLRVVRITHTKVTDASPISGKKLDNFDAYKSPLRWCSPKTWEDVIKGVSCYEKDGTEKSWWKRLFRL